MERGEIYVGPLERSNDPGIELTSRFLLSANDGRATATKLKSPSQNYTWPLVRFGHDAFTMVKASPKFAKRRLRMFVAK